MSARATRPASSRLAPGFALAACLVSGVAAGAAEAPVAGARIRFLSPDGRQPVFGTVEIAVAVDTPDPISELRLYVDGSLVARLSKAPYKVRYDVGQLNTEHQFTAEATTLFGTRLTASRSTPAVEADEQVEVELVQLYARVTGAGGARVTRQLGPKDFKVTDESGAPIQVTTLQSGNVPISTVVLVDSSESMKGEAFHQAVAGAQTAAGLLGPEDEVMIALFSDRLLRATDFTRDQASLASALGDVEAEGGSAVLDHLYFGLNRLKTRLGRPVIILFSDGEDVTSTLEAEDLRWRARRSQATLYWVRVEGPGGADRRFATFWRDADECAQQMEALETSVQESGGGIVTIESVSELSMALIRIFEDLRSQVVLGFQPTQRRHDGSWRPVFVRSAEPTTMVTARAGYVDN